MSEHDARLETALRTMLREEAPEGSSAELRNQILSAVARTPQRGRRFSVIDWRRSRFQLVERIAAAGISVLVAVVALGLLVASPPDGPGVVSPSPTLQPPVVSPTPGSSPAGSSPVPTPYPMTALIPGASNFPVIAAGSVWAPRFGRGDVVRYDPETNEIVARIGVSADIRERGPHAITLSGDDVWVNADTEQGWAVVRIDSATDEVVESIPVGLPGWAMSIVDETLWMTSWEESRVIRVDLTSGDIEAEINLPDPLGIAAAEDGVWVALGGRGTVARIDPASNEYTLVDTGTETTTIPLLLGNEVWVTTLYSQQIVVLSRQTNEVIERIRTQAPMGITEYDDIAWVSDSYVDEGGRQFDDRVIGIDIATREVVRELRLTGHDVDRGIAIADGAVWVVTSDGVARLDLEP